MPPPAPMLAIRWRARSLADDAVPEPAVDPDPHDRRSPLPDGLGRQDVLDLGGADAEGQRPERPVSRRVRVAAHDREPRQRQALLRADHVDDALARIAGPEEQDPPLPRVPRQLVDLAADLERGGSARTGCGRDVVVGDGDGEVGAPDPTARLAQHLEGVEGALVNQVAVDVEESAATRPGYDDVSRPDLVEHRTPRHGGAIVRRSFVQEGPARAALAGRPRARRRRPAALTPLAPPAIVPDWNP